mgnify:CR=1 FL=1
MITIYIDVEVTRRKRFILIHNPQGEALWTGRKLTAALEWLYEEGYRDAVIDDGEHRYQVGVSRLSNQKEP